jgi:DNA-binding MarR family transcriptional regulator
MPPRPADADLVDAVLTASRVLVGIAARSLAEVADEVTLPQYRALVVLQSRGPQSLQGLADELRVVPSTATRMCDRLVRKDLIAREVVASNRREVALAITSRGSAIVQAVTRRRRREIRAIVAAMDPEQHERFVAALAAFADAAGEVPDDGWFLGWT